MKMPGPDHPIALVPSGSRVLVTVGGQVVADTRRALTMTEASYRPVHYIPRSDVRMDLLVRSDHATYCPYKGDCAYYSVRIGDRLVENAAWSYEAPYPAMAGIATHLAFYPDRVDGIEERPA